MRKFSLMLLFSVLCMLTTQAQNYAFNFTNKTDIITIGDVEVAPPWTAEMWVYKKAITSFSSLLNGSSSKIDLEVWNAGQKVGITQKGVADWTFPTGYIVPLTTWTHLAFVCNGTKTYLYVNGVVKDSMAQSVKLPMTSFGNADQSESPNIYMDEMRLWKVARKGSDILANKNTSVSPTDQNLIGYWYGDDRALSATDISTKARSCSMSGTTYILNSNASFVTNFADMTITGVDCENSNQYMVTPGSNNQEILKIAIQTSGVSNPKTATSVTLNLNGTTSATDLTNVRLFYTGTSKLFAATQQFGTAVAASNDAITFSGNQVLTQGTNYFWVAADVKSTASVGNGLDAECNSVIISGVTAVPTTSAPFGRRVINTTQSNTSVEGINIIPRPMSLVVNPGNFTLNTTTQIVASNADALLEADFMASFLRKPTGYSFTTSIGSAATNTISLTIVNDPTLKTEGYRLNVLADRVVIEANNRIGLFWGFQSLRQLLPAKIEAKSALTGFSWVMPQVTITDAPVYKHRGSMLDVARHIFSVDMVKRYIDMLAMYKMNVFHWHLTEDQGWRIESKVFPELNTISSWRSDLCRSTNAKYGGFYTQTEIRDVVSYATQRHVTVIPEVEFPGHSVAVLAAHPELGCTSGVKPYSVRCEWGVTVDMYCAGKDTTFKFIQKLLDEIIPLFPGEYFHVGADETPFDRWSTCTDCAARVNSLGLSASTDKMVLLKKYFTDRIQVYLTSKGKKMIGWTEIIHGGITPGLTVQDWLGGAAASAAIAGNDAIQSLNSALYIDYAQSSSSEPASWGSGVTLESVYNYNIMPGGLTAAQQTHIIGAEAPLWTELISTESHLQYMLVPRIQALAENIWTIQANKDLQNFKARLYSHYERFDSLKFNNRKLDLPATQLAPASIVSCSPAILKAPNAASTYYWTNPTNSQTSTATVTESGLYKLYCNFLGKVITTSYNVTIKPIVEKPSISSTINTDTIFTASGNADNYHWYDAENGGNLLATSNSVSSSNTLYSKNLWVSGSQRMLQNALNLTGTNYLSCPPLNITSNSVTIEAWVKAVGTQNDIAGILFNRGTSVCGLNVRSNNQLMYHWNDNYWSWNSGLTLPNNTWVHVALVITPSSATMYLNDQSAANTAAHTAGALVSNMNIGFDSGNRYFKGGIDEVRVWNTALTKAQIVKNMYVQMNGNETNLVSYFRFNEGVGTSSADFATGYNGSLVNATGSDWQSTNPCPVLNANCESQRWRVNNITAIQINKYTNFEVYPNPSSGSFTTVMNGQNINSFSIKWYDITGKVMNFVPASKKSDSNQIKSIYQNIPKGVYIMSILINNESKKTAKVVVE